MSRPSARVGLVVVSHSRLVAEGTADLARQMAPSVCIVAAGGSADGSLGTDATLVRDAIQAADSGAGVVVLADLGSALIASQMALEMIGARARRVRLSVGPLVEGAVVAAIEASQTSDRDTVLGAANSAVIQEKRAFASPGLRFGAREPPPDEDKIRRR